MTTQDRVHVCPPSVPGGRGLCCPGKERILESGTWVQVPAQSQPHSVTSGKKFSKQLTAPVSSFAKWDDDDDDDDT